MDKTAYQKHRDAILGLANSIAESKQRLYTRGSLDVLANFKEGAEIAGISPFQSWLVFANKGWQSICMSCTGFDEDPESETRIPDMINFLILLHCLKQEEKDND